MVIFYLFRRCVTAPSYGHNVCLNAFQNLIYDEFEIDPEQEDYKSKIEMLADKEYWAVLKPWEYWFARAALRGGRTDVRCLYKKIDDADWDRGVRIHYRDINSSYPFQQVKHAFPVGTPKIYIWDTKYRPCIAKTCVNTPDLTCDCSNEIKGDKNIKEKIMFEQWTVDQILGMDDFFGFVCATVKPPSDMYHPLLVHFDEDQNKCIADCNEMTGVFTSVEFLRALEVGYELIELKCFHKYQKKHSFWGEIILDLYIEKMVNSKNEPTEEELEKLADDFYEKFSEQVDENFGELFREKILETSGRWGKNPAKKQTFKIVQNCLWGKHAEKPIQSQSEVLSFEHDLLRIMEIWENCKQNRYTFDNAVPFGDSRVMYKFTPSGFETSPDFHSKYLPAAVFVPAYGRLQLWEELYKIGKNVLMNDTDSIVYVYDPDLNNEIPEGRLLGDWEAEGVETDHGGIREFVGFGPKTYSILCDDGYTSVKAKGVSLGYATESIVNHKVMAEEAKRVIAGERPGVLKVPQTTFVYNHSKGIRTWKTLKDLKINVRDLKGDIKGAYLYPFGFNE